MLSPSESPAETHMGGPQFEKTTVLKHGLTKYINLVRNIFIYTKSIRFIINCLIPLNFLLSSSCAFLLPVMTF